MCLDGLPYWAALSVCRVFSNTFLLAVDVNANDGSMSFKDSNLSCFIIVSFGVQVAGRLSFSR